MRIGLKVESVVYVSARDGILKALKLFFKNRTRDEVKQLVGATTNGATPLVMACRNGHYDVAEYLIEQCGADIEQPGTVVFDGETIEGAPPLWCAVAAGHLDLVSLLVRNGAKVNSTTKTCSTPLRAACFDGHFDIVRFLVRHGADMEMANRHGHTCLMIACYRGHVRVVELLLALNADANRKSVKGNTALHDCAESGSLDVLKILVKYGARMDVDAYGMTPLLAAAVTGHTHIVEYLIGVPHLASRKECIDALELLGATYVDKKMDMIEALDFWKRAMVLRYHGDGPPITKPPPPPVVAAYEFAREITDQDGLDELLVDPDEMRMQALLIRERILGPAHPDTSYYIRYRGAGYADAGRFDRCIELWNHALDTQQSALEPLNPMTQNTLVGFTELFSFLIGEEGRQISRGRKVPPVSWEDLLKVFKKAVLEIKQGKQMIDKVSPRERDVTHLNRALVMTLQLASLLTFKTPHASTEEHHIAHKAIFELVRLNVKGERGRDVLQLFLGESDALVGRYPACRFPSLDLTEALLKVGADVSARDDDGNTVLHLIALSRRWRRDIAVVLLEAGAHIDAVNNDGVTLQDLMNRKGLAYNSLYPVKYTTLACLAARVVAATHSMSQVPKHLRAFVRIH